MESMAGFFEPWLTCCPGVRFDQHIVLEVAPGYYSLKICVRKGKVCLPAIMAFRVFFDV